MSAVKGAKIVFFFFFLPNASNLLHQKLLQFFTVKLIFAVESVWSDCDLTHGILGTLTRRDATQQELDYLLNVLFRKFPFAFQIYLRT